MSTPHLIAIYNDEKGPLQTTHTILFTFLFFSLLLLISPSLSQMLDTHNMSEMKVSSRSQHIRQHLQIDIQFDSIPPTNISACALFLTNICSISQTNIRNYAQKTRFSVEPICSHLELHHLFDYLHISARFFLNFTFHKTTNNERPFFLKMYTRRFPQHLNLVFG